MFTNRLRVAPGVSRRGEKTGRGGALGGIVQDLSEGVLLCKLLLCGSSDGLD